MAYRLHYSEDMNACTDAKLATTIRSTMIAFAVPNGAARLEGRVARVRVIASFNNVRDIVVGKATLPSGGRVDGYFFHATNAVARGVARETGLTVFWLTADRFVAVSA